MPPAAQHRVGLNLKAAHPHIVEGHHHLDIAWLEADTKQFIELTPSKLVYLDHLRQSYALAFHGNGLNIACPDGVNLRYLQKIEQLIHHLNPVFISDHLSWTGYAEMNLQSFLPISYTSESIQTVVNNIDFVQNYLERPLLLENVNTYISYTSDLVNEWDLIKEISRRSGCLLLLDLNSVYLNSLEHSDNPLYYFNHIPFERVAQIHVSGPNEYGSILYSTEEKQVPPQIWEVLKSLSPQVKHLPLLIERHEEKADLLSLQKDVALGAHILASGFEQEHHAEPL